MNELSRQILKTRQQIAEEYGVCTKTFNKLLKNKGIILDKGLITPKDQQIIYERIGIPKSSKKV